MYLGKSIALVVVLLISTTCLADISVGALPAAVTLSDLNGDGKSDLVTANLLKGAVIVLFGNGDGMFRAERSFGTGSGPWSVVVGDLNGDGKSDLVIADHGDNTVSVLIGNGNGTFQAKHAFGTGGGPKSVAVGDFNGDGVKDMVTANGTSNTASVLLGAGLTPFWATWPSRRGARPRRRRSGIRHGTACPAEGLPSALDREFMDCARSIITDDAYDLQSVIDPDGFVQGIVGEREVVRIQAGRAPGPDLAPGRSIPEVEKILAFEPRGGRRDPGVLSITNSSFSPNLPCPPPAFPRVTTSRLP